MIGKPDDKGVTFSKQLEDGHLYTFRIDYDKVYPGGDMFKKGCFDQWLKDNNTIEVPQDENTGENDDY